VFEQTDRQTDRPSSSFVTKLPAKPVLLAQAWGRGGDPYMINTNNYSVQSCEAHGTVNFNRGGFESASIGLRCYNTNGTTVTYRSVDDSSLDIHHSNAESKKGILGFTITYTRTDKPAPERVEGADRAGEALIRAQEGGNTLNFVFNKPLEKGDSVDKVAVTKGNSSAVATIKRPDGSTLLKQHV
jgi:hypothetical protein